MNTKLLRKCALLIVLIPVIAGGAYYKSESFLKHNYAEERLRQEYTSKYYQIKLALGLSDEQWNTITRLTQEAKEHCFTHCYNSTNLRGFHDTKNISKDVINLTKEYLTRYGINPECINIKVLTGKHDNLAESVGPDIMIHQNEDQEYASTEGFATIYFSKKFNYIPIDMQRHIISHEVTHLVEQHTTEDTVLLLKLKQYGYKEETVKKTTAWQNYIEAQEKCADLLPCTHDELVSQSLHRILEYACDNDPNANKKTSEHPSDYSQLCSLNEIIEITIFVS